MKISRKLRHYWHELYYAVVPHGGVAFAMRCKDVTENIDLEETPAGILGRFRFWLHLSLCQACRSYQEMSQALKKAAQQYAKRSPSGVDTQRLHQSLMDKYSKK